MLFFSFRILPAVLISEFIILFNFSGQLYSIKEKILKQNLAICPLSAHSFSLMFPKKLPCFKGFRLFTKNEIKDLILVIDHQK